MLRLIEKARHAEVNIYIRQVRRAAATGPTLARIIAAHLISLLMAAPQLLARFEAVLATMLGKGSYTLTAPLEVLSELLDRGEGDAAGAFLDLLGDTFRQQISYNQSVRLVYVLPKAVRDFASRRRTAQIIQFDRVVRADLQLADPFLDGMAKGLFLLRAPELAQFVSQALALYLQAPKAGATFLALSSAAGQQACAQLQIAVPLAQVKGRLDRYLNARLGRPVTVRPISDLGRAAVDDQTWICSDGRFIYLPEEIDCFGAQAENRNLCKVLTRLEAGFIEYGSHAFDLERAADLYPAVARQAAAMNPVDDEQSDYSDGLRFFAAFEHPALAEDLFTLFEHARVSARMFVQYPGLMTEADAPDDRRVPPPVRAAGGAACAGRPLCRAGSSVCRRKMG